MLPRTKLDSPYPSQKPGRPSPKTSPLMYPQGIEIKIMQPTLAIEATPCYPTALITPDMVFWKKSKINAVQKARKAGLQSSLTTSVELKVSMIMFLKRAQVLQIETDKAIDVAITIFVLAIAS